MNDLKIMNDLKVRQKKKTGVTENNRSFSICDEVLIYAERVIISITLQKRILNQFCVGH